MTSRLAARGVDMSSVEEAEAAKKSGPSTTGTLLYILAGPINWALQFTAVYGGHTLACALGASAALATAMLIALTAAAAFAMVLFLLMQDRAARLSGLRENTAGRRSYDLTARVLAFLSLVAIIWTGGTALLLDACVQGR